LDARICQIHMIDTYERKYSDSSHTPRIHH
jgi:hypothetical protein